MTETTKKRRPRGSGTIVPTATGFQGKTWINGKRKSFYGRTKTEVANKIRDAQAAAAKGEADIGAGGKERLGPFLQRWLETIVEPKLRRSTITTYRGYIKNHLIPQLGHHRLNELTPEHVDAALAAIRNEGRQPTTIKQIRAILRSALSHAEKRGLVARNVVRLSEPPRVRRPELAILSQEQAVAFVKAAASERLGPLWILLLDTGLRRGEALGLRWQDIDLDEKTLRVVQARESVGKGFGEPKSKESRRALVIADVTVEALSAWKLRQAEERQAAARWEADDSRLHQSERHRPEPGLSVQAVQEIS